jgi:hypothetical protein
MIIKDLNKSNTYKKLFESDINNREINIYKVINSVITGESLFYPNILLFNGDLLRPVNETIMSLKTLGEKSQFEVNLIEVNEEIEVPLFYFIYNTDNYYHFIYDTLPYLVSYFELKKEISDLKLLMALPNESKTEFYKFVYEFLDLLDIWEEDIILVKNDVRYKEIYVSSSYTHGHNSNLPPRNEIYDFYKRMVESIDKVGKTPKKIYISRRTWLHGDFSNIGTNYTTRRKMVNEDELVEFLIDNGFTEVFTENLSTIEKIQLFYNAEVVVGAIGGGLCNVLFSKPECKLISLISPCFLDINERFIFSFNGINHIPFEHTEHIEKTDLKTNMRVKVGDIVGEIKEIKNDGVIVSYSNNKVSGWNNDVKFNELFIKPEDCVKLDNGLNSPWKVDLVEFKKVLKYE